MVQAVVRMTTEFAVYMRRLRVSAGFETADDVMRASGSPPRISAHAIRAIERGNVDRPKVETLELLAEMYSVPLAVLLYRAGYTPEPDTETTREAEFMELYRGLADEDRGLTVGMMRRLLAARRLRGDEGPEQT